MTTVERVLSLAEVAAVTPWSVRTLRRLCKERRIEHERVGRTYGLTETQVAKLLDLHRVVPDRPDRPLTAEEIEAKELEEARAANIRLRRAA